MTTDADSGADFSQLTAKVNEAQANSIPRLA